jgi:DNA-directed RNA polymerase sigma subunit (sigma70/sigma32)
LPSKEKSPTPGILGSYMLDKGPAGIGGDDYATENFDGKNKRRPNPKQPPPEESVALPSDLARYRWYGDLPSRDEERDLVRRAHAGDDLARTRHLQSHHRCVLKIAGAKYHGLAFQDRVAAGMLGLNIAIDRRSRHATAR